MSPEKTVTDVFHYDAQFGVDLSNSSQFDVLFGNIEAKWVTQLESLLVKVKRFFPKESGFAKLMR